MTICKSAEGPRATRKAPTSGFGSRLVFSWQFCAHHGGLQPNVAIGIHIPPGSFFGIARMKVWFAQSDLRIKLRIVAAQADGPARRSCSGPTQLPGGQWFD